MEEMQVGTSDLVQLVDSNKDTDFDSAAADEALLLSDDELNNTSTKNTAVEKRKAMSSKSKEGVTSSLNAHSVVQLRAMTVNLCCGFFAVGIIMALLGPTLLDLACNTSSNLGSLSYIFTARSAGYLTGSIIGGFLFDRFEANMLLGISQVISTAGALAVPYCKDVVVLAVSITSGGMAMGFLDTGGNVLLLRLWGAKSAPYMQALHFAFGLGAFVAPLVAKPFLVTPSKNTSADAEIKECTADDQSSTNISDLCGDNYTPYFQYSFWISAALLCATCLGFFYFAVAVRICHSKVDQMEKLEEEEEEHGGSSSVEVSNEPQARLKNYKRMEKSYVFQLLSLMFVFYFFYIGIEVTYGGYIASYAVCQLDFSKGKAAVLTSVFWGLFALCRGGSVFLAACKLSPGMMMFIDIIGSIGAIVVLCVFLSSEVMLWIGTAVLGASIASMFPTMISWVEQYIEVTGKRAAVFVVGASFGEMVLPLATGRLFITYGPSFFIYCTSAATIISTLLYLVLVCRAKPSRMRKLLCFFAKKKRRSADETDQVETDIVMTSL